MEILNILVDDDPDGLYAHVREVETERGLRYPVIINDQETGEEIPHTRRVFPDYVAAFAYAKQATNKG